MADSHGLSRSACLHIRRSANPQVAALQRHRLPKLMVPKAIKRQEASLAHRLERRF